MSQDTCEIEIQFHQLSLTNRYFALRHATSLANEQAIIVSDPAVGCVNYGLSPIGKKQISDQVKTYKDRLDTAQIYSSDFLRTQQTAEILAEKMQEEVQISELLRERYFGDFDLKENTNYEKVWRADYEDPAHKQYNVESVVEVANRLIKFVNQVELNQQQQTIVCVSHGDALQIMQCLLQKKPIRYHRELEPLMPAELRSLN